MEPVKFEKANAVYKGNGNNVVDLPCLIDRYQGGERDGEQRSVTSVWSFTDEEREQIAAGANLAVCVYTPDRIPPMLMLPTAEGVSL